MPIAPCSDTPRNRIAYHGSRAADTAPDAGAVAIAPAAAVPIAPTAAIRLRVVLVAVATAFPDTRPRLAAAPSAPAARAPPPVAVATRDCVQTTSTRRPPATVRSFTINRHWRWTLVSATALASTRLWWTTGIPST